MSWIDAIRERMANLVRARAISELDEEIRHHLELETKRQLDAGVDPVTARRRALEKFGDPRRVADATRAAARARRTRRRRAGFSLGRTLAAKEPGLHGARARARSRWASARRRPRSACSTPFLLRPLPFPASDKLVVLEEVGADKRHLVPSYPNFDDWRNADDVVRPRRLDDLARSCASPTPTAARFACARSASRATSSRRSASRHTSAASSTTTRIASAGRRSRWRHMSSGKPTMKSDPALGFVRNGSDALRIVGVAPPGFELEGRKYDLFYPHEQGPGTIRNAHYLTVYARIKPTASLASARDGDDRARRAPRRGVRQRRTGAGRRRHSAARAHGGPINAAC